MPIGTRPIDYVDRVIKLDALNYLEELQKFLSVLNTETLDFLQRNGYIGRQFTEKKYK